MSIWKTEISIEDANSHMQNTAAGHLGIEVTEIGVDFFKGRMPVDARTHQPAGILHGGASILFAETLGSFAAQYAAGEGFYCVGQEVNGNHLRGVSEGWVYGVAKPHHIGRKSQVWGIEITNEQGKMVCISRLTVAVLPKP
ncbi:MAG: hotdog fold thioesterase [OCS116 cluster bacterium]|uniref:Thioesterase n=1 Tax=OCS116 cluster bacterium TaxID=2030921 RepID=A0A2A4Z7A7_9PROT|nr:hotdog fold thioesterase [OCS116 cluster bacterium]